MSREFRVYTLFFIVLSLLFINFSYACVYLTGVTKGWRIIEPGTTLNLGKVGKGSILLFVIDVRERHICPPWDNWDRAWAEKLPYGIIQKYYNWYEIYFHPFTLIVTNNTKDGNYTIPVCVQDQGTGIKECFNVKFEVEEAKPKIVYNISRDFNTLIITLQNKGNTWEICKFNVNVPAETSEKKFYLPANYQGKIFIRPLKEGKVIVYINCTISKLRIEYNFKERLAAVSSSTISLRPGEKATVLLRKEKDVNIEIKPGKLSVIYDYPKLTIYAPSDIKDGIYNITIIASRGNEKQVLRIKVYVRRNWEAICPFINFLVLNRTIKLESLKSGKITIIFENQDNEYHKLPVSISSDSNLIFKEINEITLPPNSKKIITLEFAPLSYGKHYLKISIPPCKKEVTIYIYVNKPREKIIYPLAEISTPEIIVAPEKIYTYPITGTRPVKVTIYNPNIKSNVTCNCLIAGHKFLVFDKLSYDIDINLSEYNFAGTYTYPIPVICKCGNKTFKKILNVEITIKEVHDVEVRPEKVTLKQLNGNFSIIVTNKGNTVESIDVISTCPFEISESSFVLNPGESKEINVKFNVKKPLSCEIIFKTKNLEKSVDVEIIKEEKKRATFTVYPVFWPFYFLFKYF